jgi:hypothetical protein
VKIVVSTFQILLDALSHRFVKMDLLALIVFDEDKPALNDPGLIIVSLLMIIAHNCVAKHPGAIIMTASTILESLKVYTPHLF